MTDHPITATQRPGCHYYNGDTMTTEMTDTAHDLIQRLVLAARAAQRDADQELEACCEWFVSEGWFNHEAVQDLRAARRPEPSTLKEQALAYFYRLINQVIKALEDSDTGRGASLTPTEVSIIRRALEALPDD